MAESCDLLVRADFVLTQDDERTVLPGAALAVRDGLVAALGPAERLEESFAPARRIDLGAALVMPGLVNACTNAGMTVFRGLPGNDAKNPATSILHDPRAATIAARIACAEMIRTGTTCFADVFAPAEVVLVAADESGLRCVAGGLLDPDANGDLEGAMEHPRLRRLVTAPDMAMAAPGELEAAFALSRECGCLFVVRTAVSARATTAFAARHGVRPLEFLRRQGMLAANTLLTHCADILPEEIEILAASGAAVVHCPRADARRAVGFAPVRSMLEAGARLALGTGSPRDAGDLNMFGEMNAAALMHKAHLHDPMAVRADMALDMATRGGADALGWPGLGRLAPGSPADFMALDLTRPGLMPLLNPVSQAVYAATGHENVLTVCAGRVLFERGRFTTIDHAALAAEAAELAALARSHAG